MDYPFSCWLALVLGIVVVVFALAMGVYSLYLKLKSLWNDDSRWESLKILLGKKECK